MSQDALDLRPLEITDGSGSTGMNDEQTVSVVHAIGDQVVVWRMRTFAARSRMAGGWLLDARDTGQLLAVLGNAVVHATEAGAAVLARVGLIPAALVDEAEAA
jgi:hypothetical protein